jgi:hypothetical protein
MLIWFLTLVCLVDMSAKILRMFAISGSITFCLGLVLLNSWHCRMKLGVCVVNITLISHITAMLCYATDFVVTI